MKLFERCKPTRIVVLGTKGFIGARLCTLLREQGLPVHEVSSSQADLTKRETADRLAATLRADDHLVFVSALTPDKGRDAATLMRNLEMAITVIDALTKQPVRHLTYISSDAVYTDSASLVDEQTPCDPGSFHGIMHISREKLLNDAAMRLKIPFCRLRPCALFGPGDTHNSYGPNRFVRTARADKKIVLGGGGEEKRDHLFVDDFCKIIIECLVHSAEGTLNAASGQAISFFEIAERIATARGGVAVEKTVRTNPITHRHFDVTTLIRTFPTIRFTSIESILDSMFAEAI